MEREKISTSIDAYHTLNPNSVKALYERIMGALKVLGNANTEVIADYLTLDHSKVHKRVAEMARLEMIYKTGIKSVMKSGRLGFNWSIRGDHQPKVEHTYKKN